MSLANDLTADIGIFLNTNEFGIQATYNGKKVIDIVFDNEGLLIEEFSNGVEGFSPQAFVRSSDIPSIKHGDTLLISGITYNVIGITPDGTGLTKLMLSKD